MKTRKQSKSKASHLHRLKHDPRAAALAAHEVIGARNRAASGAGPVTGMARIHQQALWLARERAAEPQARTPDSRRTVRGPKAAKTPRNRATLLKNIMTRNPAVIEPDESVQVAAKRMDEMNIGFLPVCEN